MGLANDKSPQRLAESSVSTEKMFFTLGLNGARSRSFRRSGAWPGACYNAAFSAPTIFFMSIGSPFGCCTTMIMAHLPKGVSVSGAL